jgi:hypothetical protein
MAGVTRSPAHGLAGRAFCVSVTLGTRLEKLEKLEKGTGSSELIGRKRVPLEEGEPGFRCKMLEKLEKGHPAVRPPGKPCSLGVQGGPGTDGGLYPDPCDRSDLSDRSDGR